jgi:hypothetical protein
MNALISPAARARRSWPAGVAGRRAVVLAVPLLAAALAAGCATASSGTGSSGTSSSTGLGAPSAGASATAAPASASATPVPTVSGGPVVPGQPACVGWPTGATSVALPVSFVPVSVERCVNGVQAIPGKGLWSTSTLERSDSGLAGLISALRQPSVGHHPGTVCPALAVIPPQVVLIGANGEKLVPRLPSSGCGLVQSRVLAALAALRWQPVSVRLIAQVSGAATPTVSGTPHAIQTVGGAGSQ